MSKSIRIVTHSKGWAVKRKNAVICIRAFTSQQDAIDYGRELARKNGVGLIIEAKGGLIRDRILERESHSFPS